MPLPRQNLHTGLIVVTLWQNNHAHGTLENFENATRQAIMEAKNLLFDDVRGTPLPKIVVNRNDPPRRLASWVVRLQDGESAIALAERLKNIWVGENQAATQRRLNLGNGHETMGHFRVVKGVRALVVYEKAFARLYRKYESDRAEKRPSAATEQRQRGLEQQIGAIDRYLSKIIEADNS